MGVKLTVVPDCVAGTRKGGEDLFLIFTAFEDASVEGVEVVLKDGNVSWNFVKWDEEEEGYVQFLEEDTSGATLRCVTDTYEFDWVGTQADLVALFEKVGGSDKSKWSWWGSIAEEPKKKFYRQYRVGGNAC